MKKFNEPEFNYDFGIVSDRMVNCGLDGGIDMKWLEERLRTAGGALNENTGIAYPGGLVSHIALSTLLAERLAKMVSGTFTVDLESLDRVCTLMHLSKIEMFIENPNSWEVQNRKLNYTFADTDGNLKFGIRSVVFCMNHNIKLTPIEVEAMTILDKSNDGNNYTAHENILSTIVRQANEMAYAIEAEKQNKKEK